MAIKVFNPWDDEDCIQAFIEKNSEDFDLYVANKGEDTRQNNERYWVSYCEAHESEFSNFAYEYHQDDIATQDEFKNDLREDR